MKLTDRQKAVYIVTSAYGIGVAKGRKLLDAVNAEKTQQKKGYKKCERSR